MSLGFTRTTLFCNLMETAINRALTYDPAAQQRLLALDDKLLEVHCTQPNFRMFISGRQGKLCLASDKAVNAETKISGNLPSLMALLNKSPHSLAGSGVVTAGDLRVIDGFRNLFTQLDLDWEAMLNQLGGDVLGHQVANGIRAARDWLQASSEKLPQHIAEYLHTEIKIIPAQAELSAFSLQVDELRANCERFEARLEKLHISTEPGN